MPCRLGVALDYRFRPANMNASIKRNLPRADLYNVANYWGRWEDELTAAGFGNGALYKKFLLDSPYLDHKDSDLYDLLAREAWKERRSKDIQWDELPSTFEIDQDKRIYRSPHVDKACALWSVERSHVKEVSLSKPPEVQNPYEMARRCFWNGALCSEEEAFRDSLLEAIDDVRCIELMRSFSDPVGKPVTARRWENVLMVFVRTRVDLLDGKVGCQKIGLLFLLIWVTICIYALAFTRFKRNRTGTLVLGCMT